MKKFAETVIKNDGGFFAVHKNGKTTYEIQGLTSSPLIIFGDWVSPEDHQKVVESNKAYETSNLRMSEENAKFVVENIELTKQIAELKSQLEKQQPKIPQFVAEWIKKLKVEKREPLENPMTFGEALPGLSDNVLEKAFTWIRANQETYMRAWLNGYTSKEKLYKVVFPKSHSVLCKTGEVVSFAETVYEKYLLENAMTESEIKAIDERYWQFAVPVEEEV